LSEAQKRKGTGNVTAKAREAKWRHRLKIHDRQAKARALVSHGAASKVRLIDPFECPFLEGCRASNGRRTGGQPR
jgi:hypothetical protein